jgi:hypothetical protein
MELRIESSKLIFFIVRISYKNPVEVINVFDYFLIIIEGVKKS